MTARRSMTAARKWRIWLREGGKCRDCGQDVPVSGSGVIYDHANQLVLSEDDSDANVFPICRPRCSAAKDAKDATARGKVRRCRKKDVGQPRAPSRLRSGGFRKGPMVCGVDGIVRKR